VKAIVVHYVSSPLVPLAEVLGPLAVTANPNRGVQLCRRTAYGVPAMVREPSRPSKTLVSRPKPGGVVQVVIEPFATYTLRPWRVSNARHAQFI
jgi:hypothetical protein